jgi:hypothetical protein
MTYQVVEIEIDDGRLVFHFCLGSVVVTQSRRTISADGDLRGAESVMFSFRLEGQGGKNIRAQFTRFLPIPAIS